MTTGAEAAAHVHAERYDPEKGRIGMWLFLFTEVLLFGTLFITYAIYLFTYKAEFGTCSRELDVILGGCNTLVLLTSSLTVALSIAALGRGRRGLALGMLGATVLLAATFLVVKYFEWGAKFHHDIYPGAQSFLDRQRGDAIFYNLYFTMTGLHGIHVVVGIVAMGIVAALIARGKVRPDRPLILENTGLYWHLVDIIWIYLFPLFYLMR